MQLLLRSGKLNTLEKGRRPALTDIRLAEELLFPGHHHGGGALQLGEESRQIVATARGARVRSDIRERAQRVYRLKQVIGSTEVWGMFGNRPSFHQGCQARLMGMRLHCSDV